MRRLFCWLFHSREWMPRLLSPGVWDWQLHCGICCAFRGEGGAVKPKKLSPSEKQKRKALREATQGILRG